MTNLKPIITSIQVNKNIGASKHGRIIPPKTIVITLPKPLPPGAHVKGVITPDSVNDYISKRIISPLVTAKTVIEIKKEPMIIEKRHEEIENPPRKRQKLDHLSYDEKLMRRKLKNRVAAQSARDRKKVRMEELEEEVAKLSEKVETLSTVVDTLSQYNTELQEEKDFLQNRLGQCTCKCGVSRRDENPTEIKAPVCGAAEESAVLPLPRAVALQAALRTLFLMVFCSQTETPLQDAKELLEAAVKKDVPLSKHLLQKITAYKSNEELPRWMEHHQPPWQMEVAS